MPRSPTQTTARTPAYTPFLLAAAPNSLPRMVWNYTGGVISLWNDVPGTGDYGYKNYGPFPGWSCAAEAVDSTSAPRILWTSGRTASLWKVAGDTTYTYQNYPFPAGYVPVGLACGTGGDVRLLWSDGAGNAQVWTVAADGTYAAKTYSAVPAAVPLYLSNLTLASTTVTGGSGMTGTVTLSSPAPAAGATVQLRCDQSTVSLPPNVVVKPFETSASFAATTSSVTDSVYASISGSYNGWTQTADVTITPPNLSLAANNVMVSPGNGCVVLTWDPLPTGSIKGFKVYQQQGSVMTLLTPVPVKSPYYPITGLSNGSSYTYQVSVVTNSGQESFISPLVSGTPSSTTASMRWVSPPTAVAGTASIYATTSSAAAVGTVLLIDGQIVEGASTPGGASSAPGSLQADIDSTQLSNGTHTLQLLGYIDQTYMCATPPISVTVTNDLSSFSCGAMFDPTLSETANVDANIASGSAPWTVQIIHDADGSVTRIWTGTGSLIHLSWDGKDNNGAVVTDDNYTVQIGVTTSSTTNLRHPNMGATYHRKPIALVKGSPNMVILITQTGSLERAYGDYIVSQLNQLKANYPAFTFWKPIYSGAGKLSDKEMIKLWNAMHTTVTDFYVYNHGGPAAPGFGPAFVFGTTNFWSRVDLPQVKRDGAKPNALHFIMPVITSGRQYNFAFVDTCNSGGGDSDGSVGTPNSEWADAFNIGTNQDSTSCWIGWNGSMVLNELTTGAQSSWFTWREKFWNKFATTASYTTQAFDYADNQVTFTEGETPYDTYFGSYRNNIVGDTTLP